MWISTVLPIYSIIDITESRHEPYTDCHQVIKFDDDHNKTTTTHKDHPVTSYNRLSNVLDGCEIEGANIPSLPFRTEQGRTDYFTIPLLPDHTTQLRVTEWEVPWREVPSAHWVPLTVSVYPLLTLL